LVSDKRTSNFVERHSRTLKTAETKVASKGLLDEKAKILK